MPSTLGCVRGLTVLALKQTLRYLRSAFYASVQLKYSTAVVDVTVHDGALFLPIVLSFNSCLSDICKHPRASLGGCRDTFVS